MLDAVATTRLRRARTAELALAAAGVVTAALVAFDVPGPLRAVLALVVWLLLPGWALIRRFDVPQAAARLVLTVVSSAVITTLVSLAMVWTGWWYPVPVSCVLLLAGSVLILLQPADSRLLQRWSKEISTTGVTVQRKIRWALIAAGIVLWAFSVPMIDTEGLGDWGLLPRLPLILYVALAVTLGACAWELAEPMIAHRVMAAGVTALVLMLNSTASLAEAEPRLPWSYKHIAVTRYIDLVGSVNPDIDLYNRWPGFFSLTAMVGRMLGYRNPLSYASWSEFGFSLLDVLLVFAIARAISNARRVAWTAALVFALANWVGQNYFAPQPFAFALYLASCLLLIGFARAEPSRLAKWVERLLTRRAFRETVTESDERAPEQPRRATRAVVSVAILLMQAVIVMSHQLTPYLAVLAILPLSIMGYFRPRSLGFGMLALAVLYLLPNFSYVEQNFGLFSGFDPVANVTYSPTGPAAVSAASVWQGRGVVMLSALTLVLAFSGFARNLWRGQVRITVIVMWLAVAPVLTLLGQTYGGEGKFRVLLFGLPWYAIGVAWLFRDRLERPTRLAVAGRTITFTAMLVLFVGTYYQPEADYRVPAADVAASEWLDGALRDGDSVITAAGSFPVLIGPNYPLVSKTPVKSSLSDFTVYAPDGLTADEVKRIVVGLDRPSFVVFSDNQTRYANSHGELGTAAMMAIEAGLSSDQAYPLVYSSGQVRIYKYR